jgi:two-component system CheB/CheR fusion protein
MPKDTSNATRASKPFPIVGIGASAGGIEALEGFFRGVPASPGIAFVIITHLSPDRESYLGSIIQRSTTLHVKTADDGIKVEPDCVYVLPPNAVLTIRKGCLELRKLSSTQRERKPVDVFLGSLAKDQNENAVSIVLSGGDGDGALGTKAVKERGGLTMAQIAGDHGPGYPEMPDSAIATGLVDFAVPVGEMGEKLVRYARDFHLLGTIEADAAEADRKSTIEEGRAEICSIIRNQIGHDFAGYKDKTFLRRVQRRMHVRQMETLPSYIELLRQDPAEVNALFRDLLINVTNFFRDADAFEKLKQTVIPKLFDGKGADDAVRVWVPGCATGEEVFSIAMLMREHMDTLRAVPRVQIFATDIDEPALGVARAARYPEALLDTVSPERRNRFFIAEGGSFVLSKEVRDLCIFSPHSLIRDPPFSRIDLVSCRNLLIYFGAAVQNQVIPIFYYSLRPGGYLFLGTAENVSQFNDLFVPLDKKHRIFRSREDAGRRIRLPLSLATGKLMANPDASRSPARQAPSYATMQHAVEGQVIERYAPPHVVTNREGDIVFFSSRTGRYLETPAGIPTRNLLNLARKGIRLDIRAAFREAVERNTPVTRRSILETDSDKFQSVNLTVEPLRPYGQEEPVFLVLFEDEGDASDSVHTAEVNGGAPARSLQLEQELREVKDRLQSTIEEYETSLEELKASNEELVSVNEELQSTNEELEASKEELQSMNEELHTVNLELTGKIDALDLANSDLHNLFESTQIATVFLDRNLTIRSFTPAMAKIFNIRPTDRGRPITDLASRLDTAVIHKDIQDVLASGNLKEREIRDDNLGTHYLVRINAYRSPAGQIEGVVATFVDVTRLKAAEARQNILIRELHHRTRNLLAIVQSLASQTLRSSKSLADFKDVFEGRLSALSRVQSLLSAADEDRIPLETLLKEEFDAFESAEKAGHLTLSGPPVSLPSGVLRTLALAVHELLTNAVKHGALASDDGRIRVEWKPYKQDDASWLRLEWVETGVDQEHCKLASGHEGFGRYLLEKALPQQFGAQTTHSFENGALHCVINIPLGEEEE